MPTFQYEARDAKGNLVRGSVEAESERASVRQLQERGYFVTTVRPEVARPAPRARATLLDALTLRVSPQELSVFFRELHTMIHAGMSLYRALDVQANNTHNAVLRRVLHGMTPQVLEGKPLSGEMAKYPSVFSPLVVGLVRAGEEGGILDRTLKEAAEYLEKEYLLRQKVKRAVAYPVFVAGFAVLVATFLPHAGEVVKGNLLPWLRDILRTAAIYGLPILAIVYGLRLFLPGRALRRAFDGVKLYLPVIGKVVRRLSLSKFSRALASLYSAGVPLSRALPIAADACGNLAIGDEARKAVPIVEKGGKLSEVLGGSPYFTQMVTQMVITGEETGALDTMLVKVADHYEAEAETAIHQMAVTAGPVLLIIVAFAVVLPQLVSFYGGYFQNLFDQVDRVGGP